jgi:hypothetical protein
MSSKELDNLVRVGILKAQPAEQSEFDGLLEAGRTYLADLRGADLSPRTQFNLAYDAAHAFSLAALIWHGYRPNNTRSVVFQALQHTVGFSPAIWRVLATCHDRRNLAEYHGNFVVDSQLLTSLLATADLLQKAVENLGPMSNKTSL